MAGRRRSARSRHEGGLRSPGFRRRGHLPDSGRGCHPSGCTGACPDSTDRPAARRSYRSTDDASAFARSSHRPASPSPSTTGQERIRDEMAALGLGGSGSDHRPRHRRRARAGSLRFVGVSRRGGDSPPHARGQDVRPRGIRRRAGDILGRIGRARDATEPRRGYPALLRLETGPRGLRRREAEGRIREDREDRRRRLGRARSLQRRGVHIRRTGRHEGQHPRSWAAYRPWTW